MKKLFILFLTLILVVGITLPSLAASKDENYYSVLFKKDEIPEDFEDFIEESEGEVVYTVPEIGFAEVKGEESIINEIKSLRSVDTVNPAINWSIPKAKKLDMEEYLEIDDKADSYTDLQWDIKRVTQNGESYDLGTGSHDVVIGIIDTGIDKDHPDLVKNLVAGSKNFVPEGGFLNNEPYEEGRLRDFDDRDGHGSYMAGAIAGNGKIMGVAPNVGVRAYRVIGKMKAESAWIFKAIIAAADDGVDVISMSIGNYDLRGQAFYRDPETNEKKRLGDDSADIKAYKRAIKYAQKKDVIIVAAAGNDGINCTNKHEVTEFLKRSINDENYKIVGAGFEVPATLPGVITVSATGPNDELASYSNYGPGYIDIAAPGGNVELYEQYLEEDNLSEYFENGLNYQEMCFGADQNGGYFFDVGTSLSTPKVSAVIALLIDKYGKMSPNRIKHMLVKDSVDSVKGRDKRYFGGGFVNAYKALSN